MGKYQQFTRRPGKALQKTREKAGKIEETWAGTKPNKLHDLPTRPKKNNERNCNLRINVHAEKET